jgi:surface antigen
MRRRAIRYAGPMLAGLIGLAAAEASATAPRQPADAALRTAEGTRPAAARPAATRPAAQRPATAATARPAAQGATAARPAATRAAPAVEAFRTAAVRPVVTRPAAATPVVARPALPAISSRVRLTCVPYARMVTGIDLRGNARTWWAGAAGRYDRTQAPEIGAVLSFRASGGMRAGHVAVVEQVLGPRHILIHHANWEGPGIRKGTVTRSISVVDVSPGNDWTQVRVQTGLTRGVYGRVYPTDGFIHNRPPASGRTLEAGRPAAPVEVAEAPAGMSPHLVRHLSVTAELLSARN